MKLFVPLFLVFVIGLCGFIRAEEEEDDDETGEHKLDARDNTFKMLLCFVCFLYRRGDVDFPASFMNRICDRYQPKIHLVENSLIWSQEKLYEDYSTLRNSDINARRRRMPRACPYVPDIRF